ncbi:hypothetical protein ACFFVB_13010 [Formosa undariae]|uniref:Matrixin family metalloprotease n=1 Tax=Formosa undariae TaxID=1325436 RepID=A0ABV5F3I0_9FLAO
MRTKIVIKNLYKFKKAWQIGKARRVSALMNQVINSNEFKNEVLEWKFSDRRYRHSSNEDYQEISDNNKILEILMKGYEQNSNEGEDYTWVLNIKLGRLLRQVGRREGDLIITQNWFFKKPDNEIEIAAHWFHEYSHILGFHHDYDSTERRPDSVPYALGTIVKKVLENSNIM